MLDFIIKLISIGGGIAGYTWAAYFLWNLWKKSKSSSIRIYADSGTYEIEDSRISGDRNIIGNVELSFLNEREEPLSITDIFGTLKYNCNKYEQNKELLCKATKGEPFMTVRPLNFNEAIPATLAPKAPLKLKLIFKFDNVMPDFLERVPVAHFEGFLSGDLPIYKVDEREFLRYWENHPVLMLLSAHINGKEIIKSYIYLAKKDLIKKETTGSINFSDMARIGKEFWEEV